MEKVDLTRYGLITEAVAEIERFIPCLNYIEMKIASAFATSDVPIYTYDLEKILPKQKQRLITFVIDQAQLEYPPLTFNTHRLMKFANGLKPFDAEMLVDYIHETYADVDFETVSQLQQIIQNEMVGHWNHTDLEDIVDVNSTGIQLRALNTSYTKTTLINSVVKFAQIVLSGVSPIATTGFDNVEEGVTYKNNEFKSIRIFLKDTAKVMFQSTEAREHFKTALYKDPWEILGRPEPQCVPTEPIGICTACLMKPYMCDSCDADHCNWTGDCKYCFSDDNKYNSHSDCDKCKTGIEEKFRIIISPKTPELEAFLKLKSKVRP